MVTFASFLFLIGTFVSVSMALSQIKRSGLAPYHRSNGTLVDDSYLVVLHPGHTIDAHFKAIGLNLSQTASTFIPIGIINGYGAELDERTVHEKVRLDPGVRFVEHDSLMDHISPDSMVRSPKAPPHSRGGLLRRAWQIVTDRDTPWFVAFLAAAGKGTYVYILDTGIRISHSIFKGQAVHFKDYTRSPFARNQPVDDTDGHGTHVAGIVIQNSPGVKLVNVKIADTSVKPKFISVTNVANAINAVLDEHNLYKAEKKAGTKKEWSGSVINVSGGMSASNSLAVALKGAYSGGISIVAAAGNQNIDSLPAPCNYKWVVCVASCDLDYYKAPSSNYGSKVDIVAPGAGIESAWIDDDDDYRVGSGTSQAAPAVAAALSIFVGLEEINTLESDKKTNKAYKRLSQNLLEGALTGFGGKNPTPNRFVQTGINHPLRERNYPYYGPDGRETASLGGSLGDSVFAGETTIDSPFLPIPTTLPFDDDFGIIIDDDGSSPEAAADIGPALDFGATDPTT